VPLGRGLRRGENFWLRLTTASVQCLRLSERFFHSTCVRSYLMYGSETWPMKAEYEVKSNCTEMSTDECVDGVKLNKRNAKNSHIGLEPVSQMINKSRLRWFGHVERKKMIMTGSNVV